MNLFESPQELDFRREVREFALAHLSERTRRKVLYGEKLEKHEYVDWQKKLHSKGWIAPSWPVEYGGTGWSLAQRRAFHHELAACCAPEIISFGLTMIGPVIYTFGSEQQKEKYLPAILASDTWWCQGFSEPNAGSDLASVRTVAADRGDCYVVNGQKTWTTHGRFADMMFCLARTRTDGRPHDGLSFLLVDMKAEGVEVRPITTIDGGASICEVFLHEVVVPKTQLVGVEGRGWEYARFLLAHERAMIARVGRSRMQLDRVKSLLASPETAQAGPAEFNAFRLRAASIEARLRALEISELRVLESYNGRHGFDASSASMLKVEGSEICQALTELLVDLNGSHGLLYEGRHAQAAFGPASAHGTMGDHLFNRVATIYGGSSEIQRNVIARQRLTLR